MAPPKARNRDGSRQCSDAPVDDTGAAISVSHTAYACKSKAGKAGWHSCLADRHKLLQPVGSRRLNPDLFPAVPRPILQHSAIATLTFALLVPGALAAESTAVLRARIAALEQELAAAQAALAAAESREDPGPVPDSPEPVQSPPEGMHIGPFRIGGAIRANFVLGDYPGGGTGPNRGGHGGDFALDTFRINVGFNEGPWSGALEYRWYSGYNFLHTGWLGVDLGEAGKLQAGVTRVPFGPGPYGNSASWFFDQHYYVGLADDMDLGIVLTRSFGKITLDLGVFAGSEGNWRGTSLDSARYSYDPVRWHLAVNPDGTVDFSAPPNGFRERLQLNARAIASLSDAPVPTDIGISLQYGRLKGVGTENADHVAASIHMVNTVNGLTLGTQLTWYDYDISATNPWGSSELLPMGAYDFAWPVAARAWIPSVSLRYHHEPAGIPWLDSVTPYIEYSSIVKRATGFNDSELFVLGAAWAAGGWYVYTDFAWSNGNLFVGSRGDNYGRFDSVGDFGVNGNNRWNRRFNINFGYYF